VLTDYAADVRAETPSGAAELISSLFLEACARTDEASDQLQAAAETSIRRHDQWIEQLSARMRVIAPSRQVELLGMRVDDIENRLLRRVESRLSQSRKAIDTLSRRVLQQHPKLRLELARQRIATNTIRLHRTTKQNLQAHSEALLHLNKRLENSSLKATLDRGYAILQTDHGRILPDKKSAETEKSIRARLRDGEIQLRPEN
jgi:exodeoxyribonuclease VII large subunit